MSPRSLVVVAVLAVAGLLGILTTRRRAAPPPPPAVARATAVPNQKVETSPSPAPDARVVRPETYFAPIDETKITSAQAAAAAARYRERARYPRTSRPLENNLD